MAKGLCCAAQAAGDLGKPLVIDVVTKTGIHQRCGVCEVVPSCRNPNKRVFAFRFLKNIACGLAGRASCTPTAAGIAQYTAQIPLAAAGREITEYRLSEPGNIPPFMPRAVPGGGARYALPNP